MLITQFIIGSVLIAATVVIHAVALDRFVPILERLSPFFYRHFPLYWKAPMLAVTVLGVFFAHILEIWLWAIFYYLFENQAISGFEEALYFSTATFTTAGYGDITLSPEWRLLGSFEAANGFILFGWSTAFIFEIISKLYKDEKFRKNS